MDPAIPQSSSSTAGGRLVLKNTLILGLSQALSVPLSVLVNAVSARYLGAEEFGYSYLAQTFATFGFLFVEWGHGGVLPALVARSRERAGVVLGSAVFWSACASVVVTAMLVAAVTVLDYAPSFPMIMALAALGATIASMSTACQEAVRGFERTDIAGASQVGMQLMLVALVIPTLLMGGRLQAVLVVQAVAQALVLVFVVRTLKPVGVNRVRVDRATIDELLRVGFPFVLFNLAMVLQPNVDAFILARYVPPETVGWYSVARRLLGVLIYPASALISALYPTLCRLYAEDMEAYRTTSRSAIRGAAVLVVPVTLGCALYPDLGIRIFGRASYAPAEDNLRILALFLLLVYFSMPLGVGLLAAGRQRVWALVQALCVIVSAVLDPILVVWFQARTGNGGLGVCVASVVSEILMVSVGIWLTPPGVFDRSFLRTSMQVLLAALAMSAAAWLTSGLSSFAGAPLAVVSYAVALWAVGGIDPAHVALVKSFAQRKVQRK